MDEIKFGMSAPMPGADLEGIVSFAARCDSLGFDSIWIPDHLVFVAPTTAYEAWTVGAIAADKTQAIHIGSVSDPHRMHPAVFAQRLATVDHISRGRVKVALGVGESMNLDPYGISWSRPLARLREAMDVMKTLWRSKEPQDYRGEFYNLNRAFLQIHPWERDSIPIYLATHTPKGLKLVGEAADGWLPIDLTPSLYRGYLDEIEAAAKNAGRSLEGFDPCLWVFTSLGKDEDDAYRTLEPYRYVLIMQDQLAKAGYDVEIPEEYRGLNYFNVLPTDEVGRQRLRDLGKFFPREAVLDFTITGSKKDCIKKIEKFIESGVRHFVLFYRFSPDPEETLRVYANEIMPYFKGA
jgi:alkanesulfonate monooxygenase SsuD/methylene tetrahydromethanopterin reductase-like flavin-dependent oxidoreductase (luciferase family)